MGRSSCRAGVRFEFAGQVRLRRWALAYIGDGAMVVTIDRGDYFQTGLVIAKGGIDQLRAAGLPAFRSAVSAGFGSRNQMTSIGTPLGA